MRQKCAEVVQVLHLPIEVTLRVFRCAKCRFQASFAVKSQDFVVFRAEIEFLALVPHT